MEKESNYVRRQVESILPPLYAPLAAQRLIDTHAPFYADLGKSLADTFEQSLAHYINSECLNTSPLWTVAQIDALLLQYSLCVAGAAANGYIQNGNVTREGVQEIQNDIHADMQTAINDASTARTTPSLSDIASARESYLAYGPVFTGIVNTYLEQFELQEELNQFIRGWEEATWLDPFQLPERKQ